MAARLAGRRRRRRWRSLRRGSGLPVPSVPRAAGSGEYAAWAFADEDEQLVECRFGEPVVGVGRAAVEYWALLRRRDGGEATLAGIAVLRFAPDGRVAESRDYWDLAEGDRTPNLH